MAKTNAGNSASERYILADIIGAGTYGEVWRSRDTATGLDVAIKVVDLDDIGDEIQDVQQEISMLRTCQSPNIVQCYGAYLAPGSARLHIVMELMAVSVADLIAPELGGAPLPEATIAYVLREVLNAIVYLHSEHRIHRDIKAANVLLSSTGMVKVSDFGVAAQLGSTVGVKRKTFVGSPLWMAPEVIQQSPDVGGGGTEGDGDEGGVAGGPAAGSGYDEAADIWSLGITAMEMALGEPPRSGVPSFRLLFLIVREPPPQLEGNFSVEFKDFVWQCLRKAPADRPSAIDLLMHPFVAVAERPPDLPQRIARVTEKKEAQIAAQGAAATQGEDVTAGGSAAQGWDFGTERAAPPPADIHATVQRRRSPSPVRDYSGTFVDRGAPLTQNASPFSGTVQRPPPVDIPASPPSRAAAAMSSASGSSRPLADAAPLKLLLQPALRAAAGGDPKATAAAESAAAALAHLESTTPGATRAAVAQMLSILGSSTSASLSDLRSSAQTSLGGGGKGPALPVELSAEAGAVSSSVDLGPLGNFLLARWQGEVSRETQGPV